ncbi:hypothetical protein BJ912DRAFT_1070564 [Pholiota molesta]|nr:hypothetical protein BJ912DRAFT_1070564 [Pholiota molesta]
MPGLSSKQLQRRYWKHVSALLSSHIDVYGCIAASIAPQASDQRGSLMSSLHASYALAKKGVASTTRPFALSTPRPPGNRLEQCPHSYHPEHSGFSYSQATSMDPSDDKSSEWAVTLFETRRRSDITPSSAMVSVTNPVGPHV